MFRILLSALLVMAPPALASDPTLAPPLDCTLGEECFILNYVDSDPAPGVVDFTCGPRSYDGHKGTDFAVLSHDVMRRGVPVFPVAPGVVTATRDGMPDLGLDDTPAAILKGRDCGNGLVVDHGDGWTSQYCHLKLGSLAVRKNQAVTAETQLGQVGYSVRTQFPHVHVTLRQKGEVVDPFNTDAPGTCARDDGPDDGLWADPIPYDPGGLVAIGMAQQVPDFAELKDGGARGDMFPASAPALVGWALVYGGRAGDVVITTITRPDGSKMVDNTTTLDKDQAMLFRATGKKRRATDWPIGDYTIEVALTRDAVMLDRHRRIIHVETDALISR